MCDVLIEAEEFGLYKTFDLENVDVIVILAIPPLPVALRKCWMRINMKPW